MKRHGVGWLDYREEPLRDIHVLDLLLQICVAYPNHYFPTSSPVHV